MTNTETEIKAAARILGKATAKIAKSNPALACRLVAALAAEVEKIRSEK